MDDQNVETQAASVDQELAELEAKLKQARERKLQADRQKAEVIRAEIAKKQMEEAQAIERKRLEYEESVRRINAKKEAERQAQLKAEQDRKAEDLRLQSQLAAAEKAVHEQQEHEAQLRKLSEQLYLEELEAKRIEAETIQITARLREETAAKDARNTNAAITDDGRGLLFGRISAPPTRTDGMDGFAHGQQLRYAGPDERGSHAVAEVPEPVVDTAVRNDRISSFLYDNFFGPEHRHNFYVSQTDGDICLGGIHWHVMSPGVLSNKTWGENSKVYVALEANGEYRMYASNGQSVKVRPTRTDELARFVVAKKEGQ